MNTKRVKVEIDEELKIFLKNSRKLEKLERNIAYMRAKIEKMEKEKQELENEVLSYMLRRKEAYRKQQVNTGKMVETQKVKQNSEGSLQAQ